MRISPLFSSLQRFQPQKLALGVFDGFHLGHQSLCHYADSLLSLYPHPKSVLGAPHSGYLTLAQERGLFFSKCYLLHFDQRIAALSAQDFLDQLHQHLKFNGLVIGYDFCCGSKRQGDIDFISAWCAQQSVSLDVVSCYELDGVAVKSETIRHTLKSGNFNQAITYLGHPYVLSGPVVKGDGRGKALGFPTANLKIDAEKCLPCAGVYQAYLNLDDKRFKAIVYIGSKPTFSGQKQSIEVHILDLNQDLYGQHLVIFLTKEIRKECRFENQAALIKQIKMDIASL